MNERKTFFYGLADYCRGCRHKLSEGIETDRGLCFCDAVLLYSGVNPPAVLQTPRETGVGKCWQYSIPSPYDEQLQALLRGKKYTEVVDFLVGHSDGFSPELRFYADVVKRYYSSKD